MVEHALIRVIAFTGSTRTGKSIAAAAAKHLKRVHLEAFTETQWVTMRGELPRYPF